jgi:hypothetical protein
MFLGYREGGREGGQRGGDGGKGGTNEWKFGSYICASAKFMEPGPTGPASSYRQKLMLLLSLVFSGDLHVRPESSLELEDTV